MGASRTTKQINIAGVHVNSLTLNEAVSYVMGLAKDRNSCSHVVTPNPEIILEASKRKDFLDVLNNADLSLPDGIGVLIAAEVLNENIPNIPVLRGLFIVYAWIKSILRVIIRKSPTVLKERVSGVDVVYELFNVNRPLSVFLIGGLDEKVLEKAVKSIEKNWVNVNVVGYDWGGKIDNNGVGEKDDVLIRKINAVVPDILLVGVGAPKQDLWISKNLKDLKGGVAIGVGGTIDFIAGEQKRAPTSVRRVGLEWFWRLVFQPRRIKRIINAIVLFPFYVSLYKLRMVKSTHGAKY